MKLDENVKRALKSKLMYTDFKYKEDGVYSIVDSETGDHIIDLDNYARYSTSRITKALSDKNSDDRLVMGTWGDYSLYIPGTDYIDTYRFSCSRYSYGMSNENFPVIMTSMFSHEATDENGEKVNVYIIGYRVYSCYRFVPIVVKKFTRAENIPEEEVFVETRSGKLESDFPKPDEVVKKAYSCTKLGTSKRSCGTFRIVDENNCMNTHLTYDRRTVSDIVHAVTGIEDCSEQVMCKCLLTWKTAYENNLKSRPRKKRKHVVYLTDEDRDDILNTVERLRMSEGCNHSRISGYSAVIGRIGDNMFIANNRVTCIYNLTTHKKFAFGRYNDKCVFNPKAYFYGDIFIVGDKDAVFRGTGIDNVPIVLAEGQCIPWAFVREMIFPQDDDGNFITKTLVKRGLPYIAAVSCESTDMFFIDRDSDGNRTVKCSISMSKRQIKSLEERLSKNAKLIIEAASSWKNCFSNKVVQPARSLSYITGLTDDSNLCAIDDCTWKKILEITFSGVYDLDFLIRRAKTKVSGTKKIIDLIYKYKNDVRLIRDYINERECIDWNSAADIGASIEDFPLFPEPSKLSRLVTEIMDVRARVQIKHDEERYGRQQENYERNWLNEFSKLNYSDENYILYVPDKITDLVVEGKKQKHCLESYTTSVSSGREAILFMRRKSEPDEPFLDIDVDFTRTPKVVRQIHGANNSNISECPDADKIMDTLVAWSSKNNVLGCGKENYGALCAICN